MATPATKRTLDVVEIATGNVVHQVDVTGKSEEHIDRVIGGMLINMDTDRFCVGEAPEEEGDGGA
jgi:hypothetical protein